MLSIVVFLNLQADIGTSERIYFKAFDTAPAVCTVQTLQPAGVLLEFWSTDVRGLALWYILFPSAQDPRIDPKHGDG